MANSPPNLPAHLLGRLREVQQHLGFELAAPDRADTRFADVLDSMGMVEFLARLGEDCGVSPGVIEACVNHRFGTVAELAAALERVGLTPRRAGVAEPGPQPHGSERPSGTGGWLAATAVCLPTTIESAATVNERLHRPVGWLERHAGIVQRRVWAEQDPLAAAAQAGLTCLQRAGLTGADVAALLVTSEAPPLLVGLAAALHHRLQLPASATALEIGGACTGFLAALWTAQALLARGGAVLVLAVEAATRWLTLQPGLAGEAAALFGDGAAAVALSPSPTNSDAVALERVCLAVDGSAAPILQVEHGKSGFPEVRMNGIELASRAVHVMAQKVQELAADASLALADLEGVVPHGGNGRLPGLLARKLGLPNDRVWSETPTTGNLGSASLPVAWAARQPRPRGPVVWTAVGAGLTWGAVLLGKPGDTRPGT
jgi:3-oxoacyl-[acyl-carrier-protein] synthase-3